MLSRALRAPIGWAVLLVAVVLVCASIFSVVPETSQALVVRLGVPTRVVNRFRPGEGFGGEGPGLLAHLPLIEQVVFIDKRVRNLELDGQPVVAGGRRFDVDAIARYRIVDPLRLFRATGGDERRVADALKPVLGFALGASVGQPLATVRDALNRIAGPYGAVVTDVRISRAQLAEGPSLDGAYERMRQARLQQAMTIRAEGAKQAAILRAEADADAARTDADAFNQDPDFYDFYRSMQSYRASFAVDNPTDGTTTFVLSPQSDYFRNFAGRGK